MDTKQKFDPAQAITSEIIAPLEKGAMPWRRPWAIAGGGMPLRHNGEGYKGINVFLLGLRAAMMGYSSPYWMTFNQAKELDACIERGSRSSVVVYYGTGKKRGAETACGDEGGDPRGRRLRRRPGLLHPVARPHPHARPRAVRKPGAFYSTWCHELGISPRPRSGWTAASAFPASATRHMPRKNCALSLLRS